MTISPTTSEKIKNRTPFSLRATAERHHQSRTGPAKASDYKSRIAFLNVSIDKDSMGQQLRVRAKRKRRISYLRRKNAAVRAVAMRPKPSKQQSQKESATAE